MNDKSNDYYWRRWETPYKERRMFLYYRGDKPHRTLRMPRRAVPALVVALDLVLVIVCGWAVLA
jgi:hypothetical protein